MQKFSINKIMNIFYVILAGLSQSCLGCICEAASGCNTNAGCEGDVCGPFRITWGYWADGGKPTLNNEANTANGGI